MVDLSSSFFVCLPEGNWLDIVRLYAKNGDDRHIKKKQNDSSYRQFAVRNEVI